MRKTHLLTIGLLLAFALTVLIACEGSSSEDTTTDGDTSQERQCNTNADCTGSSTNWTCNTAAGLCIDQGTCQADSDCILWFGEGSNCNATGLCIGGTVVDGDVQDGDVSDGDVEDGDTSDGDVPVEGCFDFSGFYDGEYVCGSTQNLDTWVAVDWIACTVQIFNEDDEMGGTVAGDRISLSSGKQCTGEVNETTRVVTLECQDGCKITLTPKTNDESDAVIETRPLELRFGAVAPGEESEQELTITNLGTGDLEITHVFFTPETSSWYRMANAAEWNLPQVISSGSDATLIISLSPEDEIATEGILVILSNAQNQPVTRVKMTSDVKLIPRIELDPPVLNFGSAPTGYENCKFFLIKSVGGAPANVTGIEMEDDQNGAFYFEDWNTTNAEAKPPFTLESSFSKPVYMCFKPIEGTHATGRIFTGGASLTWVNKDEMEEQIYFELIGKVVEQSPACLDIQPLGGTVGFAGMGEFPGPGIKFGYAQFGTPTTQQVSIHNCGDQPLEVKDFVWQNPFFDNPPLEPRAFNEAPGAFRPYTLQRGETVYIDINFFPSREGALFSSAFLLMHNASRVAWAPADAPPPDNTMPVTVGVSGIGARRGIEILPSKLDFGEVTIDCCSRPEELAVYNVGDLTLEISDVQIGAGSDERFELLNVPALPVFLGGEGNPQSFRFEVKYCAESEGPAEGRVEVTSNDDNSSQFIVPLKGSGTTLTHQKDVFDQVAYAQVDVMWVVDCSGSMDEEHDKVRDEASYFVNEAVNWDASLQLSVVSCDIITESHSGKMQGDPKVLSNETMTNQAIITEFKNKMNFVNCEGGAQEAGLEAAHLALSEPLVSTVNAGFLRDDAKLAIIFLSDEEDQSVADIPFFIDFFRSIKGMRNVNMIEVYAIVGDHPNGCDSPDGSAASGKRYIEVADSCNVHDNLHFFSICEDDYHPVFENLAEHLFALRNQFFLSRLADPATISVKIDGRTDTSWEYDEYTNSILFDENNPPAPGSQIEVEYDTLCLD